MEPYRYSPGEARAKAFALLGLCLEPRISNMGVSEH